MDKLCCWDSREFYKVVSCVGNKYYSYAHNNLGVYPVEYKENEVAIPLLKNSKLFVFETLFNVQAFIWTEWPVHEPVSIFRVKVENPKTITTIVNISTYHDLIDKFWLNQHNSYMIKTSPQGTFKVDSLMLLEKVAHIETSNDLEKLTQRCTTNT